MKKIISVLICLSMLLSLVYVSAFADDEAAEYSAPQGIYYYDFEGDYDETTNTGKEVSTSGSYNYVSSTSTGIRIFSNDAALGKSVAMKDSSSGATYLSVKNTAESGAYRLITQTKNNIMNADKYVFEYKIRPMMTSNASGNAIAYRAGSGYGVPTVNWNKGNIYSNSFSSDYDIADYENGEWYTVAVVFDRAYTANNNSASKRDIYINGELIKSGVEYTTAQDIAFMTTAGGKMILTLNVYHADQAFDIDYIKYYASADTFAAKLPRTEDVKTNGEIEVWFNGFPDKASLLSNAKVVDSSGKEVCGIKSVTYNNNFNPGTDYAQSITLNLNAELESGTAYKLKLDGVTDSAEKTLTTELSFETTSIIENKDYINPPGIYYQDFEDIEIQTFVYEGDGVNWTDNSSIPGFYKYKLSNTNSGEIVADAAVNSKYLKMSGSGRSFFYVYNSSASMPSDPDKYIVEYKLRPTNVYGSGSAVYANYGDDFGLPTLALYGWNFNTKTTDSTTSVGRYNNAEWYTMHIVYDGEVDSNGNTVRDIYINGELVKENVLREKQLDSNVAFMDGAGYMKTVLGYLGREEGSLEVDYIKYYASADTFTVKVPNTTNVISDKGIEVQFNNIPDKDSLIENAVILDKNGDEVCGIKSVTYNNNFNPGNTYAQSVTLNFEKALERNEAYSLRLIGVNDISGNKVSHIESFQTARVDFVFGEFSFAEGENGTYASIDIENNTEEAKELKLIIAGYEETDGSIKLTGADISEITANVGSGSYSTKELDSSDCSYVKAYLWDSSTLAPISGVEPGKYFGAAADLLFNNTVYEDAGIEKNGNYYVSVDKLAELIKYSVTANGSEVVLNGDGDTISLSGGSATAYINGEAVEIDYPLEVAEGSLMITAETADRLLPVGIDVETYFDGAALHKEYYDENYTFSNLITTFIGDDEKETMGDPGTMRGFSWQANPEYDDMILQYSTDKELKDAKLGKIDKELCPVVYGSEIKGNYYEELSYYDNMLFYKADVTDLKPGTTYYYRIGDTEKNEWSEIYSFTTEAEDKDSFSIVVVADSQGDTQAEFEKYGEALDKATSDTDAEFLVHLGDLTEHGMRADLWDMFFDASSGVNESLPIVATVGNHETRGIGTKYYNMHFNNPQNALGLGVGYESADATYGKYMTPIAEELDNTVYSFDYGDVHFAVVNTGTDLANGSYATKGLEILNLQKEWLVEDMKATDKKWKILIMHIGVYPARSDRRSAIALYSVVDECGIDYVMQGHDHLTMRTKPMKNQVAYEADNYDTNSSANGTVYAIMGCAGTKRYNYGSSAYPIPQFDWMAEEAIMTDSSKPSYNIITFTEDSINITAKDLEGTILDSYSITK